MQDAMMRAPHIERRQNFIRAGGEVTITEKQQILGKAEFLLAQEQQIAPGRQGTRLHHFRRHHAALCRHRPDPHLVSIIDAPIAPVQWQSAAALGKPARDFLYARHAPAGETPMIARRPLLAAALLATPSIARAQGEWPVRPVRIIVPWPPGGSTDVLVRMYAELMQPILGQNFIIENRPGAGGNIGIDATAKAAPDGYTMGIASVGHLVINNFLYARLPYDPARDLVPVGIAWDLPNVVVVSSQHNPSRSLADFTAWVRAKRGGFTYGSPGVGTTGHLTGALFAGRVQVEGTHVPFRGAAQIIPAMLSGDLDSALDNLASYVPVIQEGRMRALAVTSAARWPTMPDVPTMAEAGLPDFVVSSWQGFVFPAGTPRIAIERVNGALRRIVADPAVKERFLRVGAEAVWSTPEDMIARAQRERPMWQEAVRVSGARLE
jgi:tripartite-type tricarboxylate transporter receptor subunit TctC